MSDKLLRRLWLALASLGGAGLIIWAFLAPQQASVWVGRLSPGCLFHRLTGLSCPGCGGTRALRALLQGDWAAAWSHNMFLWISLLLLAEETVQMALQEWRGAESISLSRWRLWLLKAYAAAAVLWFVLRNAFGI